jgi:hypothetical protein
MFVVGSHVAAVSYLIRDGEHSKMFMNTYDILIKIGPSCFEDKRIVPAGFHLMMPLNSEISCSSVHPSYTAGSAAELSSTYLDASGEAIDAVVEFGFCRFLGGAMIKVELRLSDSIVEAF